MSKRIFIHGWTDLFLVYSSRKLTNVMLSKTNNVVKNVLYEVKGLRMEIISTTSKLCTWLNSRKEFF